MINDNFNITLLIFACESREQLLPKTIASFRENLEYGFNSIILALDGKYDTRNIDLVKPDLIINNYQRGGYIKSICNALKLVNTEFLFWLEEDWEFNQPVNLNHLLDSLRKNPEWVQIRLSKIAPLTQEEKANEIANSIYESIYGFSANPCLCRTSHIKAGFEALQKSSFSETLGFEEFLSLWFSNNSMICTVLDPEKSPMVIHSGYLESTPRQWHMTASLGGKTDRYLSAMEHAGDPKFWQKCLMIYKLNQAAFILSIRILLSRAAYDLSFRIFNVIRQFKDY